MRYFCRILSLFVCVCMGIACMGCAASPPDYFAYREGDFCAELRGTLDKKAFCAKITVKGDGTGRAIEIEYLADEQTGKETSLTGLKIFARCGADGTLGGAAQVVLGEMDLETEGELLAGVLSPVTVLLSPSDFSAVQKEGDSYRLTFSDGAILALDTQGLPRTFSSPSLSFEVIWWEK